MATHHQSACDPVQDRELFFVDCDKVELGQYKLPVSGDISSIDWSSPTDAWIGGEKQSVYQVDMEAGTVSESFEPTLSVLQMAYYWGVDPIYQILPKPAAMDDSMTYLLSGKDAQTMNFGGGEVGPTVKLSIWGPLLSNSAFIVVVLTFSCIYVARKEF